MFFFKQKTAYEMRISDLSSDVCSSDLAAAIVMTSASGGNLHIDALRRRARDFDPATRDRLLAGALLPANAVLQAQRFRALFREQVLEAFRHHDLLIAPATPSAAPPLGPPTITVAGADRTSVVWGKSGAGRLDL